MPLDNFLAAQLKHHLQSGISSFAFDLQASTWCFLLIIFTHLCQWPWQGADSRTFPVQSVRTLSRWAAALMPPVHHLPIFPLCIYQSGESSPCVEGLRALLPLSFRAGWYKYATPSLPSIHLWLLTLKGFVIRLWWQLFSSICMTNKYWLKKMDSHLHNTFYEILKGFFPHVVIWTKTVQLYHFMVTWL